MKNYIWRKLKDYVHARNVAVTFIIAGVIGITGCGSPKAFQNPIKPLNGPPVQDSKTYYSESLACLGTVLNRAHKSDKIVLSVDQIPDQTGKFNYDEEGYVVTQGAETMVISALGKTNAFTLVERTHLDIPLFELEYARDFVLSDKDADENYIDEDGKLGRAIYSGAMKGSDYVVLGNISEVNFNIGSGGFEVFIDGIGGGWRAFWLDVAIDLRVIEINSTEIILTLPLRKQIVGYENKLGVVRFWGETFVNANAGSLTQEPIQIAVRAIIEGAVGDITRQLYNLPADTCLPGEEYKSLQTDSDALPPGDLGKGKSLAMSYSDPRMASDEIETSVEMMSEHDDKMNIVETEEAISASDIDTDATAITREDTATSLDDESNMLAYPDKAADMSISDEVTHDEAKIQAKDETMTTAGHFGRASRSGTNVSASSSSRRGGKF